MWEPRRLKTLWAFTTCHRNSVTFTYTEIYIKACFVTRQKYAIMQSVKSMSTVVLSLGNYLTYNTTTLVAARSYTTMRTIYAHHCFPRHSRMMHTAIAMCCRGGKNIEAVYLRPCDYLNKNVWKSKNSWVFVFCNTQTCMYQSEVKVQRDVSEDLITFCFDL
jgi:hypothetical protein